ncbi:four helix bundle protein [Mesonia sp. K7]|uniref:four helix bundle protein n=1 Tax=Mesonia sp. K7 TaxID=2218606 RepID=UPI000DA73C67|nr:four helix bundle protein [Mesonia sp. K7]PZD76623.1 four helix bundle protein [Mesonia sp. K7]
MAKIASHRELKVYQLSFEAGMDIFHLTKTFPKAETYSLTDQIRRSSRSVSGNLAEAWRKRRYEKAFVAKLSDVEGEAAETQTWLDYAHACKYINIKEYKQINEKYEHILGIIVNMIVNKEKWIL